MSNSIFFKMSMAIKGIISKVNFLKLHDHGPIYQERAMTIFKRQIKDSIKKGR